MKSLLNQRGVSLMELMTVVAIIAILSMIAIPSYQGYQAKARQKEGLNLLGDYYTAAASARLEFGIFPGNFKASGFQPTGRLNYYRLRADDNPNNIDIMVDDQQCFRTQAACDCGGACTNFKTWTEAPAGGPGAIGIAGVQPNPGCGLSTTTDNTLKAQVAGWISTTAQRSDKYQIDEMKRITMCQDGLK